MHLAPMMFKLQRQRFLNDVAMAFWSAISQGSPTPRPQTGTGPRPGRNCVAQQAVSGGQASKASSASPHLSPSLPITPHHSHYCLNHSPPPPPAIEKLSSTKLVPGAKKVGDRHFYSSFDVFLLMGQPK